MCALHTEKRNGEVTTLAVLAVLSPVILIALVAVVGVLAVWFALFIVRSVFWLAIGGLIGLALWAGEARANTRMQQLEITGPCHPAIWMEWIKQPFLIKACVSSPHELLICTRKGCVLYEQPR